MPAVFDLTISSLSHDGRGIGFLPAANGQDRGKAVFVAGALPGMTARCRVFRDRKNYLEAELAEIIETHWQAERTCPRMPLCGGCPLLPMPYAMQLRWKESLAREAMRRLGRVNAAGLDAIWQKPLPSPLLEGFRNKAELAFGQDEKGLILGFRKRGGHEVFSLRECLILPQDVYGIIGASRELAARSGFAPYTCQVRNGKNFFSGFWRFLILRQSLSTGSPVWNILCLTSPGDNSQRKFVTDMGRRLLQDFPGLASFTHEERETPDFIRAGQKRIICLDSNGRENREAASLEMSLGGQMFNVDVASFFQVNGGAASRLCEMALDFDARLEGPGGLLDLYCGSGAPGQLLAPLHTHVFGVENDKRAVSHAIKNAEAKGLRQCRYEAGDAGKILARLAKGKTFTVDTALLDPPRCGLNAKTLAALIRLGPKNIIYISCNPVTMARDINLLREHYRLSALKSVDLFPHTPHLECCGLLRAKNS